MSQITSKIIRTGSIFRPRKPIDQSVLADNKKLIEKMERPGEKRSIVLSLTEAGRDMMAKDPWLGLAERCQALGGKTRRRMDKGLALLLADEVTRRLDPSFGSCRTCRFWIARWLLQPYLPQRR